jgi:hypothetical protein
MGVGVCASAAAIVDEAAASTACCHRKPVTPPPLCAVVINMTAPLSEPPLREDDSMRGSTHATRPSAVPAARGSHSSTFRLTVSAFCAIGGALRICRGCLEGLRRYQGVFRVCFVCETAQVELKSGRV